MASTTKFLRQFLGRQPHRTENARIRCIACVHRSDVGGCGAMTRFTAYAGNHMVELKPIVDGRGSAVATETISRLSAVNIASRSFLNAGRWVQSVAKGPIKAIDSRVVANPTFLQPAVVAKDKGLRD